MISMTVGFIDSNTLKKDIEFYLKLLKGIRKRLTLNSAFKSNLLQFNKRVCNSFNFWFSNGDYRKMRDAWCK